MKLKANQRVTLKPFAETKQPRQTGKIISVDQSTVIVLIDKKYRDKRGDDGYRECAFDQIEGYE